MNADTTGASSKFVLDLNMPLEFPKLDEWNEEDSDEESDDQREEGEGSESEQSSQEEEEGKQDDYQGPKIYKSKKGKYTDK
mgnify:CR=1 FL=1